MNNLLIIFASLAMIFTAASSPAVPRAKTAADRAWPGFYVWFSEAVMKKDRDSLQGMLLPDRFELESEYGEPLGVINFLDQSPDGGWRVLRKIVRVGKVDGRGKTRTARYREEKATFTYQGGRWYWSSYLAGD